MAEIGIPLNHSFRIQLNLAALYLVGFVRESKLLQTNGMVMMNYHYLSYTLYSLLLGYYHESHNHSKGDYGNTNRAELMWSIAKRHMRKLYGQRTLTHQLQDLCKEWMAGSQPF